MLSTTARAAGTWCRCIGVADALPQYQPVLLEPIHLVEIVVRADSTDCSRRSPPVNEAWVWIL
jgi:hypothetical protein